MKQYDRQPVNPRAKRKTCNKCGSDKVAWAKSNENRWYFTEVFYDGDSVRVTAHNDFHSQYCGPNAKLDHDTVQAEILGIPAPGANSDVSEMVEDVVDIDYHGADVLDEGKVVELYRLITEMSDTQRTAKLNVLKAYRMKVTGDGRMKLDAVIDLWEDFIGELA